MLIELCGTSGWPGRTRLVRDPVAEVVVEEAVAAAVAEEAVVQASKRSLNNNRGSRRQQNPEPLERLARSNRQPRSLAVAGEEARSVAGVDLEFPQASTVSKSRPLVRMQRRRFAFKKTRAYKSQKPIARNGAMP